MTEEEISMVLNTFMYLDYKEADDGMKMEEIVADLSLLPDCQEGGIHYGEYQILSEASENPEIGELVIGNQSHLLGFDTGTVACTFAKEDEACTYVVYRGTGDGEWPDNGIGMTAKETLQQKRALSYFELVVEKEQITEADRLIVTGHSKGGNKAQYVNMSTEYDHLLDACYNVDGQGFSEEAIRGWKEKYGEEEFRSRTQKITGIYGENDYVNVLGNSIVPKEQVYYIRTPVEKGNFAGYHDIKYMFATMEQDTLTGKVKYTFHGRSNGYVMNPGELAGYGMVLSESLMRLPSEKRDGCAAFLMQIMELTGGRADGLNGEKIKLSDIDDFLGEGIPLIAKSLIGTEDGISLLKIALFGSSFSGEMSGEVHFMLNDAALLLQASKLQEMASVIENYLLEIEEIEKQLFQSLKYSLILEYQLKKEKESLLIASKKIRRLAGILEDAVRIYQKQDAELAEELT